MSRVHGYYLISRVTASSRLGCPICYDGYLLPAQDDQHVVGASFKPDDDGVELRDKEHEENLAMLQHWLPTLFSNPRPVAGRAAVRAMTPDRLPLLGAVADSAFYADEYADLARGRAAHCYAAGRYIPGLYVNVGHGARGLTSSFLCAEILAAQLNIEPAPTYKTVQDALHPARFIIRALKKGFTVTP